VPVIEDDWARQLHYEGEVPPPLKSLDPSGYVIHMGSFSKCFMPGLRIGWITCPAGLSLPLYRAKIGFDSGDAQFLQALLFEFISKGYFDKHLRKTLKEYRKRRNLMCKLLKDNLPPGCSFHVPQGGFTVWVELPEMIKTIPLLSLARELGLQFLPAAFCMPDRSDAPAFRLSFSRTSMEEIEEGILKLCRLITEVTANPGLLRGGAKSYEDLYR
jgi:2-aminoadipate transaminase